MSASTARCANCSSGLFGSGTATAYGNVAAQKLKPPSPTRNPSAQPGNVQRLPRWDELPEDFRAHSERTLTPNQLAVVKLRASGLSWDRIAQAHRVTPESVRGTFKRAVLRLDKAFDEGRSPPRLHR
jgi:DNA-binding NarL/FixJ family response regulator